LKLANKVLTLAALMVLMAQGVLAQNLPSVFSLKPYIEAGVGHDHLTNNYANWDHQYVNWNLPMQERGLIHVHVLNAQRYGQDDSFINVNYAHPHTWGVMSIDAGYGGNADFLVNHQYGFLWTGYTPYKIQYLLGARKNQYIDSKTNNLSLGLESYISDWRFAYLATHSNLNDAKSGWVNRYQWQWLSDRNRIGFAYIDGDEPSVLAPGVIANTSVKTYQVDGVYSLSKDYALTAMLWHTQQGGFYQRNGIQFGIRVSY
jgi:YaiO family outer membrane protein